MKKAIIWSSVVIVLALAVYIFVKFFYVYSEGVNEGDINYFQREGFIFKTYEGKMIQTGYNSRNSNATIQSNEFKFSVVDDKVAEELQASSGRQVKLHWQRYLGTLPWRGNSQYVVTKVVASQKKIPVSQQDVLPDIPQ